MAAQDVVEYSNQCLETINRLPYPQEVWDAALQSVEEKILQSASPTNTGSLQCPFLLVERFADNGEHSHWELIDRSTGAVEWSQQAGA
jgi:hypothetical protein